MRRFGDDRQNSAIALLIISSIFWGSSFVSIKIGLEYVNPYDFLFLRLAAASGILLFALVLRRNFQPRALKQASVWGLGLLNGLAFTLQYLGLLYTTPSKTALLIDMNVIVVALLSRELFGESFGFRKQLGVVLGVLGAALITTNGDISTLAKGELVGDLLVFSAGFVWAFFIVWHKRILAQSEGNVLELSAGVMLATALLLLPTAALLGGLDLKAIPIEGWGWIAFTALICTVLPYAMWVAALKAVTATISSVVAMLEIVAAMVLSTLLLGESLGEVTLIGAVLVLLSIPAVAER